MIRYVNLAFLILLYLTVNHVRAEEQTSTIEKSLKQLVVEQRKSAGLVGLGAVAIQNGKFIGPYVSGERKTGSKVLLTVNDHWHIGSVTKSITATMIARLVEQGQLDWDTSITEIFSDSDDIDPAWSDVTLAHLLTHTSGAVPNFSLRIRLKTPAAGEERKTAREAAVLGVLKASRKAFPEAPSLTPMSAIPLPG